MRHAHPLFKKATPDCRFINHLHQASTVPGSLWKRGLTTIDPSSLHHIRILLIIIAKSKNVRQWPTPFFTHDILNATALISPALHPKQSCFLLFVFSLPALQGATKSFSSANFQAHAFRLTDLSTIAACRSSVATSCLRRWKKRTIRSLLRHV